MLQSEPFHLHLLHDSLRFMRKMNRQITFGKYHNYGFVNWDFLWFASLLNITVLIVHFILSILRQPSELFSGVQFSSVQSLSRVRLLATTWTTAHQASLSITNSLSSLRLMSIESVMPSSHLILCRPLLLLPPIPPSIKVFSNESTLPMRWPKYCSFSFKLSTQAKRNKK